MLIEAKNRPETDADEPAGAGATPVSELAADTVKWVAPGATLVDVADALVAGDVGALVVGKEPGVLGVISERDLVSAVARRLPLETTLAVDVATTDLVWCEATATAATVAMEMAERYVRHVLVEDAGRLIGVVSVRDLLGVYAAADARYDEI